MFYFLYLVSVVGLLPTIGETNSKLIMFLAFIPIINTIMLFGLLAIWLLEFLN